MKTNILAISLIAGALVACSEARFAGNSDKVKGPDAPATAHEPPVPAPSSGPTTPSTTPGAIGGPHDGTPATPPTLPEPCRNDVSTTGITDLATGQKFLLLTTQLGYDDAVKQCGDKGMSLIFLAQELPDAVLACKQALGTLWLSPSADAGLALWTPAHSGTEDRTAAHWVICYD